MITKNDNIKQNIICALNYTVHLLPFLKSLRTIQSSNKYLWNTGFVGFMKEGMSTNFF